MDLNFFKNVRILDGGTGQELVSRGLKANGTLWSANALLQDKYHELLLNTHSDFIKAGAEVIVTATFATRRTNDSHQIEKVGEKLRAMMPWIASGKMVDKDKN